MPAEVIADRCLFLQILSLREVYLTCRICCLSFCTASESMQQVQTQSMPPLADRCHILILVFSVARQLRVSPLQAAQSQRVMIVSAAHDYHCTYRKGDYLNMISAINKQVRLPRSMLLYLLMWHLSLPTITVGCSSLIVIFNPSLLAKSVQWWQVHSILDHVLCTWKLLALI